MSFQMKNKKYKISEVISQVREIIEKNNQIDIDNRINKIFESESQKLLIQPNWSIYYSTKEEYFKLIGFTKEKISAEVYAEIIMDAFNKVINRRVKVWRVYVDGIKKLTNITDEILLKNLNIIRAVRRHEVGMRYTERNRFKFL